MLGGLGKFLKNKGLPLLGSVLGGPASIATTAIKMVAGELGIDTDNEDEIIKHIESNPETVLALKTLEANTKIELQKLQLQGAELKVAEQKLFLDDVASARSRELGITQTTGKRDNTLIALAWTIVSGFLGIVGCLIFIDIPQSNVLMMLLGTLASTFTAVVAYFFGSSKGSSDKNIAIQKNSDDMQKMITSQPKPKVIEEGVG